MAYVFISYSHEDQEYARKLADELDTRNIEYWMDDRIDYGSKWARVIQEKLENCQAVIVILTANAYNSDWVQGEIAFAQQEKKVIYPVLLEGKVWVSLASAQYVDVRGGDMPPGTYFETIKKRIGMQTNQWVTKRRVRKLPVGSGSLVPVAIIPDAQKLNENIVDHIFRTTKSRSNGEWEIGLFRISYSAPEKDLPKESQYYGLTCLDVINSDLLSRYDPKFFSENKEDFDKYTGRYSVPKGWPSTSSLVIPSMEEMRNRVLFRKRMNLNPGMLSKTRFTKTEIESFAQQLIDLHKDHHIPLSEIKIKVIEDYAE